MTEEKEKIWEEATKKSYAENANGTNWDRISIAMDLYAECEVKKLKQALVVSRREQLIAFLRQQNKLHYVTIYENDFEFADKLLKAINCL